MDISTTFTAITGWLEDLEMNYGGYTSDFAGASPDNYRLFAGLIWNHAMTLQAFPGAIGFNTNSIPSSSMPPLYGVEESVHGSCDVAFGSMSEFSGYPDSLEAGDASSLDLGSSSGHRGCSEEVIKGQDSCDGEFGLTNALGGLSEVMESGQVSCHVGFESVSGCNQCPEVMKDVNAPYHLGLRSIGEFGRCSLENGVSGVSNDMDGFFHGDHSSKDPDLSGGTCSSVNGEMPHLAFSLALGYLGVRDLLAIEGVCKSVRSTVRNDPFYWRNIHIHHPLNDKITDEVLMQLTDRAQGSLQCLSLVECPRITDDGLKRVLDSNPKLSKLCVPGCTRLSINGILDSLRTFKLMGTLRVKHIRIGGLYGVTEEHFEELKFLLGITSEKQQNLNALKPYFYHRESMYLSCEDDRTIDIETCPRCQKLRLVYDCPAEVCQGKKRASQVCRACTLCIARCVQCGRCINDNEYEETFCLELLCSDCSKHQLLERHEMDGSDVAISDSTSHHEDPQGSSIRG
ncbi:uncharacterized protein J3R85_009624 [Psidium guajava]|nr:uncharacterized protein J3R85_009624 [Psidium guajava]